MRFKKHFFILCSLISVFLVGIFLFNFIVDPAGIFRSTDYEEGIAQIMLGKRMNAANISNYNERLLEKICINKFTKAPNVIILGSSRIMQIDSSMFLSSEVFNNGVSGASLEDYLAIYFMYEKNEIAPNTVILGIDPWIFNKNNEQPRWISLINEYNFAKERLGLDPLEQDISFKSEIKKYTEMITLTYLIESYKRFKLNKVNEEKDNQDKYYATLERKLNVRTRLSDGAVSFPLSIDRQSLDETNRQAYSYANSEPIYSLGQFTEIDASYKEQFERFIKFLQDKDTEVVFLLLPYHSTVYETIIKKSEYNNVQNVEKYIVELAEKKDIKLIGSYNPEIINIEDDDFFDGMHLKLKGIKKFVGNQLKSY